MESGPRLISSLTCSVAMVGSKKQMLVRPITWQLKFAKWALPLVFGSLFVRGLFFYFTGRSREAFLPIFFGIPLVYLWAGAIAEIRHRLYRTDPLTTTFRDLRSLSYLIGDIASSLTALAARVAVFLLGLIFAIWLLKAIWVRV